jgi:predicted GH43/DUF377 family glycosyl hydrolase
VKGRDIGYRRSEIGDWKSGKFPISGIRYPISHLRQLRLCGEIVVVLIAAFAAGCGRYSEFTLPPLAGSGAPVSFEWQAEPAPVLSQGPRGQWDSGDVLNPSVVRIQGTYHNFYSGFDGKTWRTGLATSADGIHWQKQWMVLAPDPNTWEGGYIAANGSALLVEGQVFYWYQAAQPPRIGLARSLDDRRFEKLPRPVLDLGPRGSWDERGVADPYVIREGGVFYMYYLGQDRARRQRLGVARSEDGVKWWKLRANPILELGAAGAFDENGLGEPAVWSSNGWYWMLYTGRNRAENRRLGLARSTDGVKWQRTSESPVFSGNQPWDSKVVCDPTIEVTPAGIRVWFGGGDVASPDQNLHGQIGTAVLRMNWAR